MAKKATKPVFRVGLLGESPNDTKAVARLLGPRYGGQVEFFTLVRNVTGDNLDTQGAFRQLRRDYQSERPNLVVVIRDLDALETDKAQLRQRQAYFRKVAKQVGGKKKAVYLLNIYSIEALIAAHIERFNEYYSSACRIEGDVMHIEKPVELLKEATRHCKKQYLEGNCGTLLALVNYEVLLSNCRYFQAFDTELRSKLPTPPTEPEIAA